MVKEKQGYRYRNRYIDNWIQSDRWTGRQRENGRDIEPDQMCRQRKSERGIELDKQSYIQTYRYKFIQTYRHTYIQTGIQTDR